LSQAFSFLGTSPLESKVISTAQVSWDKLQYFLLYVMFQAQPPFVVNQVNVSDYGFQIFL
jgi:hypothetical protein